jgi:hypothetical protein
MIDIIFIGGAGMYVYSRSVQAYSDKAKKENEIMLRMAQVELYASTFMYI